VHERYGETAVEVRGKDARRQRTPVVIQLPDLTELREPALATRQRWPDGNVTFRVLVVVVVLFVTLWGSPTLAPVRQKLVGLIASQQGVVADVDPGSSLAQDLPTLPIDPLVIRVRMQSPVDVARVALDADHRGEAKSEAR